MKTNFANFTIFSSIACFNDINAIEVHKSPLPSCKYAPELKLRTHRSDLNISCLCAHLKYFITISESSRTEFQWNFECHLIYYFSSTFLQQQFIKQTPFTAFGVLFCFLSSQHVIKNNHVLLMLAVSVNAAGKKKFLERQRNIQS